MHFYESNLAKCVLGLTACTGHSTYEMRDEERENEMRQT